MRRTATATAQTLTQCLRRRKRECSAAAVPILASPRRSLDSSAAAAPILASTRRATATSSEARSQSDRTEMSSDESGTNFADLVREIHRSTSIFREIPL